MWRMMIALSTVAVVALFGFSLLDVSGGTVSATAQIQRLQFDDEGYARALEPLNWEFPRNFGAHPDYQTEWWYYTGNLWGANGERFGFQFTIFRRAIQPSSSASPSEWRTNQIYMAHFTLSDISNQTFYHDERYSRGSAELAGATGEPYRVWLEDWQVSALDEQARRTRLTAANDDFALDLTFEQVKPPALHGTGGLSPKSGEAGNASHYYSLSRLLTEGTVTVKGRTVQVTGLSWKDHEFSTSALGEGAQGWDWFGLILADDYELMVGKIRMEDGTREAAFGGLLIRPDGSTRYIESGEFTITPTATWTSPHTGATYPAAWDIRFSADDLPFRQITVTPLQADQELHGANVEYWEGAVEVTGDTTGVGYAELTGYVATMDGRF